MRVCRKKVYLITFVPKKGIFQNQIQIARQEPCDWPGSHRIIPDFGLRGQLRFLVYPALCFFQISAVFFANFIPIRHHTLVPLHPPTRTPPLSPS